METVLIADDEINIREGLKNIIDWNELGFEVCAEAANGEEALCLILDKKPSLVLLDIRMPKIYGTDLIRMARERGFQGRFIILSGYSDFTYAQTAIQYGVDFYITKPIDEDELQLAICKIKKELDEEHFLEEARELQKLCREYQVPFVVNDNVDIAVAINADGVHVGQSDMEAGDVRAKLGPDKIIGVTAKTVKQAVLAQERGADYLGVGAVFHTDSKADAREISFDTLRDICKAVSIPVIAIGGITEENVKELAGTGICGVAVISAIYARSDIKKAAENLKNETCKMLAAEIAKEKNN